MVLILLETVIDLNATVDSCLLIKCIQQYIAVMMGCVFDIFASCYFRYVKMNGELRMQKGLSRERTSYRSLSISCDERIALVCCRKLIVWAISENRRILVRHGIDRTTEEGCGWRHLDG